MNGLPRLAFIFDNAGVDEWLVLGVVVFILFGPRRLPEIARTIGRTLARIRQAADEFREQMTRLEEEVSPSSPPPPILTTGARRRSPFPRRQFPGARRQWPDG